MPAQFTHADALREYLTGAGSDGGSQSDPTLSLGNFRSSTEAASLAAQIANALANVTILYAGGGNGAGVGILTATDTTHLTWQPPGASGPGPATAFSGVADVELVEGQQAGQYLRIQGTTPFTPGQSQITLAWLADDVFALGDVSIANAAAGVSEYRATIARNYSSYPVSSFQRWLGILGTPQVSNAGALGASGSGTIVTAGSLIDWPQSGWCRVETSGNTLRELVYYSARTNTTLTVPAAGRGRFGSTASAGLTTDNIYPVPGAAIAINNAGVQAGGSAIQTIANGTTAPTGVTWNTSIRAATGLQIGTLQAGQQVGLWIWREVPAGLVATPAALIQLLDVFNAY
jgi:hypothetical protein